MVVLGLLVLLGLAGCVAVPSFAAVYPVGDTEGWGLGVDYTAWAAAKTFYVGDALEFNTNGSVHSVAKVNSSEYGACTIVSAWSDSSSDTTIYLTSPGTQYFICTAVGHCSGGMKLTVHVTEAAPVITVTSPPTGGTDVPMPPISITGSVYTVGDASGWQLGMNYNNWAAGKTFKVGDGLVFKFDGGHHSLAQVTLSEYNACTVFSASISTVGDDTVLLNSAGMLYFISAAAGDCLGGMKLAIRVRGTAGGGGGSIAAPRVASPGFMHLAFLFFVYLVFSY